MEGNIIPVESPYDKYCWTLQMDYLDYCNMYQL